ncbi:MAG TPA: lipid-A-disaccharide synthase [Rhizomicrobium sp.]|jgi:lipid-A-disaccharide synthase
MSANLPAKPLTLMLVCGEPSGDQLGAELMQGLRALAGGNVKITGVGGPAMAAQGLESLFPLDATAVMGLREVVPRIPEILRRVRATSDFALRTRPDAVVCIDSPDFTHRIARRVRRLDPRIRIVNYVAPQVWASRSYRARKMAGYFDLVLALLPFEVPFFETHGIHAKFVGHPVVERAPKMTGGKALRERLDIGERTPLLALLPGSRTNEIHHLLPVFRGTVARLAQDIPGLVCVLPAVSHVAERVRAGSRDWPAPLHIVESEPDKFAAFDAADVALAASGTVTTELALAATPMVVTYRVGWLTAALMWPLVNVEYATLVNLLLGREAVPELLQSRCRADLLAPCLLRLFRHPELREKQRLDLREAVHLLGIDDEAPSLRAARALLDFARSTEGGA